MITTVRTATAFLALLCWGQARAADAPLTMPTHDVDITYAAYPPGAPPGTRPLTQRMRWMVSPRMLRVDPPARDLYFVMDYANHRLETVRPSLHTAMEMDASGAGLTPAMPTAADFERKGESVVAGMSCTEWQTRDSAGEPALTCLTDDGVLLRAAAHGRVLVEATEVHYGPIQPSVFAIPDDYDILQAPPTPPLPGRAP